MSNSKSDSSKPQEMLFEPGELDRCFESKVRTSPYSNRIRYLSENEGLGRYYLFRDSLSEDLERAHKSNCYGTAIYVLGIDNVVEEYVRQDSRFGNRDMISKDYEVPSLITCRLMNSFLLKSGKIREVEKEDFDHGIVAFYSVLPDWSEIPEEDLRDMGDFIDPSFDRGEDLTHVGVYLGEHNGKDWIFDQNGMGGPFEFSTVEKRVSDYDSAAVLFFEPE